MYIVPADPVAAIRARARERARPLLVRIARYLVAAWQLHLERQIERAARVQPGGALNAFVEASRRG